MPLESDLRSGERWQFDAAVADRFDDMLARSIPNYEEMRHLVFSVGSRFVQPGTDVVDLGCSRGEAIEPFIKKFGDANNYVGVEVSQPMREAASKRFADNKKVKILGLDLREAYPEVKASVTLSVLTLQFVPIEYRQEIVRRIYNHTEDGGALIFVEKVLGSDGVMNELLVDLYLERKAENGYTQEEIDRKRLALEGVLVPVTAAWNVDLLRAAGFTHVDGIWRSLNFCGWVAVR